MGDAFAVPCSSEVKWVTCGHLIPCDRRQSRSLHVQAGDISIELAVPDSWSNSLLLHDCISARSRGSKFQYLLYTPLVTYQERSMSHVAALLQDDYICMRRTITLAHGSRDLTSAIIGDRLSRSDELIGG